MKFAPQGAWNWWNGLIAVLAITIIIALVLGFRGDLQSGEHHATPQATPIVVPDQAALRDTLDSVLAAKHRRDAGPTGAEDAAIEEHLAKLEEDLEPGDAAARLSALGNLHQMKKGDYAAAAGFYEILIERYPEWEGVLGAYRELLTCYEMLGEQQELRTLYRKMLERFPEESDAYRAAREALAQ